MGSKRGGRQGRGACPPHQREATGGAAGNEKTHRGNPQWVKIEQRLVSSDRGDDDVDLAAAKAHHAILEREQGAVPALADAETSLEAGPTLANNDAASGDGFAAVGFNATTLSATIATVAGRTGTHFMSHKNLVERAPQGDHSAKGWGI
jgi:hypothetical protein